MNIWMNSGCVLILLNDHIIMFLNFSVCFAPASWSTGGQWWRGWPGWGVWIHQHGEPHRETGERLIILLFMNANMNISWIINLGIWNVQKCLHYQSCLCSCLDFWWQFVLCVCVEQGVECLEKLKDMIMEQCVNSSSPDVQERFEQLLSGNGHSVGLLLSERFVNVPPQIALPMHKQLQ